MDAYVQENCSFYKKNSSFKFFPIFGHQHPGKGPVLDPDWYSAKHWYKPTRYSLTTDHAVKHKVIFFHKKFSWAGLC
jgi:hypothetical protein